MTAPVRNLAAVLNPAVERIQQAENGPQATTDFTNQGKAKGQQTPVRQGPKRLKRVPFVVSRLMEFCTRRELVNQTGHDIYEWPLVILKELTDNGIDACEEAEIAPNIFVTVTKGGSITVQDNGPGIPAKTIKSILDYAIRVSSREAYCSPTRGQQGNALKTILPMAYVMDDSGEDACGKTIIEAHGLAHCITFEVDHIKQEPKITHTTKPSKVVKGTKITVTLPQIDVHSLSLNEYCRRRFLALAESYAWLNPHLSLKVTFHNKLSIDSIDIKASNPTWKKWLPSWPTCPHWYDVSRFRRYMAAHIANHGSITVREFISEFRGMTGTAKQKAVLAETGASHVTLHTFFGLHKANTKNIRKLLASLKKHTKPVRPADLGIIGKEHFYARMEAAGGDTKTFEYRQRLGVTDGLPRVSEFAFGIHHEGLTAESGPDRSFITGVNWSPGIKNPFRSIGKSGEGLDAILEQVRASHRAPVICCLHVACPRVAYTDRGKSAIVVEGEVEDDDGEE